MFTKIYSQIYFTKYFYKKSAKDTRTNISQRISTHVFTTLSSQNIPQNISTKFIKCIHEMFTIYSTKYPHVFCTVCANPTFYAVWCLLFTNRFLTQTSEAARNALRHSARYVYIYIFICAYIYVLLCFTIPANSKLN
jgi:hypothetical protein